MTFRMLRDLGQFLMLAGFIVAAFTSAFYVLFAHVSAQWDVLEDETNEGLLMLQPGFIGWFHVLGRLVESSLKGEPDRAKFWPDDSPTASFGWAVSARPHMQCTPHARHLPSVHCGLSAIRVS